MKERIIKMEPSSDQKSNLEPLQKFALDKIADLIDMLKHLDQNGGISKDLFFGCSLLEGYLEEYCSASGYHGKLEKEMVHRHEEIRNLNIENRELRHRLGLKITGDDARERVKIMNGILREWWKEAVGGFVSSETSFCACYGYHATLSFSEVLHLDDAEKLKIHVAMKEKYGIEFVETHDRDILPVMTEENVTSILRLIQDRFPSAEIMDVRPLRYRPFPLGIYELDITIRDCDDFENKKDTNSTEQGAKV